MITVIFEVLPKSDKTEDYLTTASELKNTLITMPGFISIERFQSLTEPNKLLSLSFWQDEASVKKWRNQTLHKKAQKKGKNEIFEDYRIRVASVIRDYDMHNVRC